MFPKMNPEKMAAAMKKMGVKTDQIPATEVIIKTDSGEIRIKNPQVMQVDVQGQKSFQINGDIESSTDAGSEDVAEEKFSDDDVKMVAEKTNTSEDEARNALEENDGDIAEAILKLQE